MSDLRDITSAMESTLGWLDEINEHALDFDAEHRPEGKLRDELVVLRARVHRLGEMLRLTRYPMLHRAFVDERARADRMTP
jgi:hypothetical protein